MYKMQEKKYMYKNILFLFIKVRDKCLQSTTPQVIHKSKTVLKVMSFFHNCNYCTPNDKEVLLVRTPNWLKKLSCNGRYCII